MKEIFKKIYKVYSLEIAALIGLILYVIFLGDCIIRNFIGIPCPSCGLTRAADSLLKGDLKGSLKYHLLLLLFVATIIIYLYQKWIDSSHRCFRYFYITVIIIFIIYYLIRMYYLFPDIEPMNFKDTAYINQFFKMLKTYF